jgi:hypothetical protein
LGPRALLRRRWSVRASLPGPGGRSLKPEGCHKLAACCMRWHWQQPASTIISSKSSCESEPCPASLAVGSCLAATVGQFVCVEA